MTLDFPHRLLGEVLVDLTMTLRLHVRVKRAAQIGERARRGREDERRRAALAYEALQGLRHAFGEAMLFDLVPVGRLHGAASRRMGAGEAAAGAIRPLFAGQGVLVEEHALGDEIGEFFVAGVAQEQRFAPVADKDKCIMRNDALRIFDFLSSEARWPPTTAPAASKSQILAAPVSRRPTSELRSRNSEAMRPSADDR